jgi:hypothetical protein
MRELGPVSSDQMVLCFIRSEIGSTSRNANYIDAMRALSLDRTSLVDSADLGDAYANSARALVLGAAAGYGRGKFMFTGFPGDVTWRRVSLEPFEFGALKYANCEPWIQLSDGSRSVIDGARNIQSLPDHHQDVAEAVVGVVEKISVGTPIDDLILIEDPTGRLVILEGNIRATAFVAAMTSSMFALVGSSPSIEKWHFI